MTQTEDTGDIFRRYKECYDESTSKVVKSKEKAVKKTLKKK